MSEPAAPNSPATPSPRPPVPIVATCLTIALGAGMLAAVCGGGVVLGLARHVEPRIARAKARRAADAASQGRIADAKSQLDALGTRIEADARAAGELPETLSESLPKDPWGGPITYVRTAPDRGVLRSPGPDGKIGTRDDVRRDVGPR